jgi:hypothetical protein
MRVCRPGNDQQKGCLFARPYSSFAVSSACPGVTGVYDTTHTQRIFIKAAGKYGVGDAVSDHHAEDKKLRKYAKEFFSESIAGDQQFGSPRQSESLHGVTTLSVGYSRHWLSHSLVRRSWQLAALHKTSFLRQSDLNSISS